MTVHDFFLRLRLVALCLFGALVACDPSALGRGAFDDPPSDQLSISLIEPSMGAGGTAVTLSGQGFRDDMLFLFGDVVAEVDVSDSETAAAVAPVAAKDGPVDVVAVAGEESFILADGFTYVSSSTSETYGTTTVDSGSTTSSNTDDTGELTDTGDSTSGTTTSDTGWPALPSGIVQLVHMQVACPACLGLTNELQIYGEVAFHEPVADGWLDWMPAVGSCALNPTNLPVASSYLDVGEWVYLETGASSLGLYRQLGDAGAIYRIDGLTTSQFLRTAFYDLVVPDGGAYGPFDVEDVALTPTGFAAIQPEELLLTNPYAAFSARISRSSANMLTWSPVGTGTFLVMVDVYDRFGAPTGDLVVCHGNDSGSLVLPGAYFSSHSPGSLLVVYMVRTEHVVSELGSGTRLEGVAQMGVIGTASLVP